MIGRDEMVICKDLEAERKGAAISRKVLLIFWNCLIAQFIPDLMESLNGFMMSVCEFRNIFFQTKSLKTFLKQHQIKSNICSIMKIYHYRAGVSMGKGGERGCVI